MPVAFAPEAEGLGLAPEAVARVSLPETEPTEPVPEADEEAPVPLGLTLLVEVGILVAADTLVSLYPKYTPYRHHP